MKGRFRRAAFAAALLSVLFLSSSTEAHDVPRSSVELRLSRAGTLAGHIDAARVGLPYEIPGLVLMDDAESEPRIAELLSKRLRVTAGDKPLPTIPEGVEMLPGDKTVRVRVRLDGDATGPLTIESALFPSDPAHKTFVTLYQNDTLAREAILSRDAPTLHFVPGTVQGIFSVIGQFIGDGIHHIFIGPDHILFIIGLLLLGGTVQRLLKIVTAFTLAHSITLVLATLNILNPPARVIEPIIALSIVFVGIHTLLIQGRQEKRDLRIFFAGVFGLIHGFGFASVLQELDLPREALGWSLFSFNVGVEIGQLCIVLVVAPLLALLHRKNEKAGKIAVLLGSWAVVLAGAYWFGERLAS